MVSFGMVMADGAKPDDLGSPEDLDRPGDSYRHDLSLRMPAQASMMLGAQLLSRGLLSDP